MARAPQSQGLPPYIQHLIKSRTARRLVYVFWQKIKDVTCFRFPDGDDIDIEEHCRLFSPKHDPRHPILPTGQRRGLEPPLRRDGMETLGSAWPQQPRPAVRQHDGRPLFPTNGNQPKEMRPGDCVHQLRRVSPLPACIQSNLTLLTCLTI